MHDYDFAIIKSVGCCKFLIVFREIRLFRRAPYVMSRDDNGRQQ